METIQIYGGCALYSDLVGPFYTGVSTLLNMPAFHISLFAPTSTTIHQEVAMKFATQQGLIIEFDNGWDSEHTMAFDVSSISRYPQEDERYEYRKHILLFCR